MTLPVYPGAISFAQMRDEFGGGNPVSLNQYYSGGARVGGGTYGFPGGGQVTIPGGGAISLDNFHGATAVQTGSGASSDTNQQLLAQLPSNATWVRFYLIGGGGGAGGGDYNTNLGGEGGGADFVDGMVHLPATSGPKYLYSRVGSGGGGGGSGYNGPGIGGGGGSGFAFINNSLQTANGGRGGDSGASGSSGGGGGGGGATAIWYEADGLFVPIFASSGGGGGGGVGRNAALRPNQFNSASIVGINSGIMLDGNPGQGRNNPPPNVTGSFDGGGAGGGGSLSGRGGQLPVTYNPEQTSGDNGNVTPAYYSVDGDNEHEAGSIGVGLVNFSYVLAPTSYAFLNRYSSTNRGVIQFGTSQNYGFGAIGQGEGIPGNSGTQGVVSIAWSTQDSQPSITPPGV